LAFVLKDKIFEYFVQHGTFDGAGNPRINLKRKKQDLIIEIICLIIIGLPSIYFLMKFLFFASLFSQIIFLLIVLAGNFLPLHFRINALFFLFRDFRCSFNDSNIISTETRITRMFVCFVFSVYYCLHIHIEIYITNKQPINNT
jgi:hypothetical protein